MTRPFAVLLVAFCAIPASAQTSSVMGTWLTTAKTAQVQIAPCTNPAQGPVCGQVVKLIDPKDAGGKPVAPEAVTDAHNADPSLRSRKVLGMTLLYGFTKGGETNSFENGTIYNGENGKTYKANIGLQPDGTLRVRGYVGSAMFGETQVWTRIQ
jgi:uncharacterized protein (DUF2147 family)